MNTATPRAMRRSTHQMSPQVETGKLRILATTDIHMHLTGHNYVTDRQTQNTGLAGIATLIAEARAEAVAQQRGCILFDNGDFLQGTAMGEWLAARAVSDDHPAIACLQALGYNAFGVGNHDLDYGMAYLKQVAARLRAPTVASNLHAKDISPLAPSALIPCTLPATADQDARVLQVGVLSVLPEQTALWNHHMLNGVATINNAAASLRAAVPKLRARGADLIVVLAHMGLDGNNSGDETALPLAQIPGIDAMITGHTHRRFPSRDHSRIKGVNTTKSTIGKVPAVMPGHAGSDLAVLDLSVDLGPDGHWRVTHHKVALRHNRAGTQPSPAVLMATTEIQGKLRRHLAGVVGQTPCALHNYFALAVPTHTCALTARAKTHIARVGIYGMPEAELPLLAASSAHTAGGRDGPANYLNIPEGAVLRRHLWALNPYGNQVWVVRITGAELRERLEHAAAVFNTLTPENADQPLRNPARPAFDFDTVFGVRYVIDPIRPVGSRIASLYYNGQQVRADQDFLLVTNQFRAAGGGGYAPIAPDRVVLRSPLPLHDGLMAVLQEGAAPPWDHAPWTISTDTPRRALLETAPLARQYLDDLAHLTPRVRGLTAEGFLQLELTF